MADIIPNDLSHMSDEDFNALCPQGHHAPGPEPLSPAAQAVLDAAFGRWMEIDDIDDDIPGEIAAAALRAAADQVVPHSEVMPQQDLESRREAMVWGMVNQTQVTRQQLLAIAAELENQ